MQWRIELLGRLRLAWGEREVTPFLTQKVAARVAYLAYYPHAPHPRDTLIELLWPEIDPALQRRRQEYEHRLAELREMRPCLLRVLPHVRERELHLEA